MAVVDGRFNMAESEVEDTQIPFENEEMANSTGTSEIPEFDGNIDLTATRKKRFTINGDSNYTLELNVSDMSVITRLDESTEKLEKLARLASVKKVENEDEKDDFSDIAETLSTIDKQMREIIDDIFDANVSETCAPYGSMFDPFNGKFRYQHIIEKLIELYEYNIRSEFRKMDARIKKRAGKYAKKK